MTWICKGPTLLLSLWLVCLVAVDGATFNELVELWKESLTDSRIPLFDVFIELSQSQFMAGVSFSNIPAPLLGDTAFFFLNGFPQQEKLQLRGLELRQQMKLDTTFLKENDNTVGCLLLRNGIVISLGYSAFDLDLDVVNNLKMRTVRDHYSVRPLFMHKSLGSSNLATVVRLATDAPVFAVSVSVSDDGAVAVSLQVAEMKARGAVPGDLLRILVNDERAVGTAVVAETSPGLEHDAVQMFIPVETKFLQLGHNTVTAVLLREQTDDLAVQGSSTIIALAEYSFFIDLDTLSMLRDHEVDRVADAHDFSTSAHLQPLARFAGRSTVVVPERQGKNLKLFGSSGGPV